MLRLNGSHIGKPTVDYTINAASGFPVITGAEERPVNNALPAWNVAAGLHIANGIRAAELDRPSSGQGQEISLALSGAMLATVGNLGYIAKVQATGKTRGPLGNGLYGAYGQSFATSDGHEIMVAVISNKHWRGLGKATGLSEKLAMIGPMLDVDLSTEGGRFEAREAIDAVLRPWFATHNAAEAASALSGSGVLQGEFQTFEELVNNDPWCSLENPLFGEIDQPGVGRVIAPRVPLSFGASPVADAVPAPQLGGDAAELLETELGLDADARAELASGGVVDLGKWPTLPGTRCRRSPFAIRRSRLVSLLRAVACASMCRSRSVLSRWPPSAANTSRPWRSSQGSWSIPSRAISNFHFADSRRWGNVSRGTTVG